MIIGLLIGAIVGVPIGILWSTLYMGWLDKHIPDWEDRPFPRCFLPW